MFESFLYDCLPCVELIGGLVSGHDVIFTGNVHLDEPPSLLKCLPVLIPPS